MWMTMLSSRLLAPLALGFVLHPREALVVVRELLHVSQRDLSRDDRIVVRDVRLRVVRPVLELDVHPGAELLEVEAAPVHADLVSNTARFLAAGSSLLGHAVASSKPTDWWVPGTLTELLDDDSVIHTIDRPSVSYRWMMQGDGHFDHLPIDELPSSALPMARCARSKTGVRRAGSRRLDGRARGLPRVLPSGRLRPRTLSSVCITAALVLAAEELLDGASLLT